MSPTTQWLRAAGACCVFLALALLLYRALSAPKALPNTLGFRGLKRAQALERSGWFVAIDPLLRWVELVMRLPLSASLERRIDRVLTGAGDPLGLSAAGFLALSLLSALLGAAFGLAFSMLTGRTVVYALWCGGFGVLLPYLELWALTQRRRKRVRRALPYGIELMALGLSAGLDFPGALGRVLDTSRTPNDPLIEELSLILQELRVGKTRREALTQLRERVPIPCVHQFVGSVIQAEEHGNPLGPVLQIHAKVSREERSVSAEESASKASVKLLAPMALLLVAVLLLVVAPMVFEIRNSFQ